MSRGSLMSIKEAARVGEVTTSSIYNYIRKGYLEPVIIEGYEFVYYRDVLQAAWKAQRKNNKSRTKASELREKQLEDPVKGPIMSITEAAKKAGVTRETVRLWYNKGFFDFVYIDGVKLLYYRDILRASWKAKENRKGRGNQNRKRAE